MSETAEPSEVGPWRASPRLLFSVVAALVVALLAMDWLTKD